MGQLASCDGRDFDSLHPDFTRTLRSPLAASDKWLVMEMTCDSNLVKEKSGPG